MSHPACDNEVDAVVGSSSSSASSSSSSGSVACLHGCGSVFTKPQEHAVHLRSPGHVGSRSKLVAEVCSSAGLYLCPVDGCVYIGVLREQTRHSKTHSGDRSSTNRYSSPRRTRSVVRPAGGGALLGHLPSETSSARSGLLDERKAAVRRRRSVDHTASPATPVLVPSSSLARLSVRSRARSVSPGESKSVARSPSPPSSPEAPDHKHGDEESVRSGTSVGLFSPARRRALSPVSPVAAAGPVPLAEPAADREEKARRVRVDAVPRFLQRVPHMWRTIPHRCLPEVISCVKPFAVRLLASSLAQEDDQFDEALTQLVELLPRLLRQDRVGERGVRQLRRSLANYAMGKDFLESKRAAPKPRTAEEQERAQVLRAVDMAKRGHLQKAMQVLQRGKPVDVSAPGVLESLHEMHAAALGAGLPALPSPLPCPYISPAQFLKAAKQAANGAAPGPSGTDCEVVLALLADKQILDAFTEVANRLLHGTLGDEVSSLLLTRTLVPTSKPDGGIRPISIGDSIYKITGIAALGLVPDEDIRGIFGDTQYAYGRSGGPELAVHALRTHLAAVPGSICVAADIVNAYPSRSRAAVQRELLDDQRTAFLAPLFHLAHKRPSQLLEYDRQGQLVDVVLQQDGVCQGDTTGTFNFCKSIAPILNSVQARVPGIKITTVADDVNISGKPAAVFAAYDLLAAEFKAQGIIIKLSKSFCLWPRISVVPRSVVTGASSRGLALKEDGAAKVLGAFLGDDVAAHGLFVKERFAGYAESLQLLLHPAMPSQVAVLLLRSCVLPRANYLVRVSPPSATGQAAQAFDKQVQDFVKAKLHLPSPLDAEASDQLEMPISLGGLGIRPLARVVAPAFLSSYLQLRRDDRGLPALPEDSGLLLDLQETLDLLHGDHPGLFSEDVPEDAKLLFELDPSSFSYQLQSGMVRKIEKARRKLFEASVSDKTLTRLISASAPGAGLWLSAVPSIPQLRMDDVEFCLCVRHLLGLDPADDLPLRCACGQHRQDFDHFLLCTRTTGARIIRHDLACHLWHSFLTHSGHPSVREKVLRPGESKMRADIVTSLDGTVPLTTALDKNIIVPTAKCRISSANAMEKAEQAKILKYKAFEEYDLLPLVMETHGALAPRASLLLSKLSSAAADTFTSNNSLISSVMLERELSLRWRSCLSVCLQLGNAHVLLNGVLNCKSTCTIGRLIVGTCRRSVGRRLMSAPVP